MNGERGHEMKLPLATLDHVVINARNDMDHAAESIHGSAFRSPNAATTRSAR